MSQMFLKGPTVLFLKTGRFIGNYTRSIDLSSDCQTQAWIRRCNCDCFRGEYIFQHHPTPRRTAKISCHKYMNKLGMNSNFVYRKKGCNCNHKWSFDRSTKFRTLPHPVELLNFLKLSLTWQITISIQRRHARSEEFLQNCLNPLKHLSLVVCLRSNHKFSDQVDEKCTQDLKNWFKSSNKVMLYKKSAPSMYYSTY